MKTSQPFNGSHSLVIYMYKITRSHEPFVGSKCEPYHRVDRIHGMRLHSGSFADSCIRLCKNGIRCNVMARFVI